MNLEEIKTLFMALEQSKTNDDIQILIDNDSCKQLQNVIEETCIYKDKEIEKLNNKLNAIRKYLKDNEREYGSLEDNEKIILRIIESDNND